MDKTLKGISSTYKHPPPLPLPPKKWYIEKEKRGREREREREKEREREREREEELIMHFKTLNMIIFCKGFRFAKASSNGMIIIDWRLEINADQSELIISIWQGSPPFEKHPDFFFRDTFYYYPGLSWGSRGI